MSCIIKELYIQDIISWLFCLLFIWWYFLSCWFTISFLHISEFNYLEDVKGYTVSNHGRAVLVDQRNFTYLTSNKYGKRTFWKCRKFRKKCKARASTVENYIMSLTGVHNHDPDDLPEILKTENEISHWILVKRNNSIVS